MKKFCVDVRPWNKEVATTAIEAGADFLVVDHAEDARALGRIGTIASDGDLVLNSDIFELSIEGEDEQEEAILLAKKETVIVHTTDWTIIPLENLVAASDNVIAAVKDLNEAKLALGVLEKGTMGIMLKTDDPAVINSVANLIRDSKHGFGLVPLTITSVTPVGMGDRVCVDTCSMLEDGEGMLVGNTSSGFFLVHGETLENPYVAPRPFRVNAGAVHAYLMTPGGKTAYLSDLSIGDRVSVSDFKGNAKDVTVGRVKIEKRPMLLVEAEYEGRTASLVLQNAETIRLVKEDGNAVSVVKLKEGDKVLGRLEKGGRHFGMAVDESILEK